MEKCSQNFDFRVAHCMLASMLLLPTASAQWNYWTNGGSGRWQQPFWSLGVLPTNYHSAVIANERSKTITIGPGTALNFPETLRIDGLEIRSATNSVNTLRLNEVGLNSPLRMYWLTLGERSVLSLAGSSLNVMQNTWIHGTLNQGVRSRVDTRTMTLGGLSGGVYNQTGGVFKAAEVRMGFQVSPPPGGTNIAPHPGRFKQRRGSNYVSTAIEISNGEYSLRGGELTAGTLLIGIGGAGRFSQSGGEVVTTNRIELGRRVGTASGYGSYVLSGGVLTTPRIRIGGPPRLYYEMRYDSSMARAFGSMIQRGGTNHAGGVQVYGTYTLSEGVLSDAGTVVNGTFQQSGGTHISGGLLIEGYVERRGYSDSGRSYHARHTFSGGRLTTRGMRIYTGRFTQSAGVVRIDGDLSMATRWYDDQTSYHLTGGRLTTSNLLVYLPMRSTSTSRGFRQSGGIHIVRGRLALDATIGTYPVAYELSGGELTVRDLSLSGGAIFALGGGTLRHTGTLAMRGAQWIAAAGTQEFGALQLKEASTNSSLYLPGRDSAMLRFRASKGESWDSTARLEIHNWNGKLSGGGRHQIYFGTDRDGLSAQQVTQLRFRNPKGFPPGDYPAMIRRTGEIVPTERPDIHVVRTSSNLVVSWPVGYVVQTATNVMGPFGDLEGSGSYTVPITEPQRYFRLRR